jgi:hypothetical protein
MSTLAVHLVRPQPGEYAPYYDQYISLVGSEDVLTLLAKQAEEMTALLSSATAKADFRYAPGKWSVKEVVGHINDTERIMAYRALRFCRGDATPIEGFEQNDYVRDGNFGQRTWADLTEEFGVIRKATVALFRSVDAEAAVRRGVANKNAISVRALAYVIAGHELHHRRILQEKYLR